MYNTWGEAQGALTIFMELLRLPRTGYAYDEGMLAHRDPEGSNHPETPGRLLSIMDRFQAAGLLAHARKVPMSTEDIRDIPKVHSMEHHERMLKTSRIDFCVCVEA